jgi:hypothetical protein
MASTVAPGCALRRRGQGTLFAVEACPFGRPVRCHLDGQTLRAHLEEIRAERVVLTDESAAMLSRLADAQAYDGMIIDL